jgi:hypothetical protein
MTFTTTPSVKSLFALLLFVFLQAHSVIAQEKTAQRFFPKADLMSIGVF